MDELIALVRSELRDHSGPTQRTRHHARFRWPLGNPAVRRRPSAERMKHLEAADIARSPACILAGSGYRGIGLPDCIRSGKTAAGAATA
jgi:protoporphyrinogen/coproporphyrinogen III oxidase